MAVGTDANAQLMRLLSTLGGGRAYEAVSYTHLDVYKRQGPSVLTTSGAAQRWVVMDVSDSTRQLHAQAEEGVSRARARLPQGQEAGVIAFGADAMVDTPAGDEPAFSGVSASVDRSGSDLDLSLIHI